MLLPSPPSQKEGTTMITRNITPSSSSCHLQQGTIHIELVRVLFRWLPFYILSKVQWSSLLSSVFQLSLDGIPLSCMQISAVVLHLRSPALALFLTHHPPPSKKDDNLVLNIYWASNSNSKFSVTDPCRTDNGLALSGGGRGSTLANTLWPIYIFLK
jgi:hypothetical protein